MQVIDVSLVACAWAGTHTGGIRDLGAWGVGAAGARAHREQTSICTSPVSGDDTEVSSLRSPVTVSARTRLRTARTYCRAWSTCQVCSQVAQHGRRPGDGAPPCSALGVGPCVHWLPCSVNRPGSDWGARAPQHGYMWLPPRGMCCQRVHSTAQHSGAQRSTAEHSGAQRSTAEHSGAGHPSAVQ